jgi:hypothetical protein
MGEAVKLTGSKANSFLTVDEQPKVEKKLRYNSSKKVLSSD